MNIEEAWRLLGAAEGCSPDELRSAYRRRLHELHPDVRGGEAGAAAETRELITAYRLTLTMSSTVVAASRQDIPADLEPFEYVVTAERTDNDRSEPFAERLVQDPAVFGAFAPASSGVWVVEADTLAIECPADEAYGLLVEAAHQLGDVTHVDRTSFEFLEFLVRSASGDAISVVCSLQGRANGSTEVFFTLEPLATALGPLPDVREVVRLAAQFIRHRLNGG